MNIAAMDKGPHHRQGEGERRLGESPDRENERRRGTGGARHDCSRLCVGDGEDKDEGEAVTTVSTTPAATITVSGDALVYCPACRSPVHELLVRGDGRVSCGRCPGVR
jgi:hypothetical protein